MSDTQPTDLFDYIAGQQFTTEPAGDHVNDQATEVTAEEPKTGEADNVDAASTDNSQQGGVTADPSTNSQADSGQSNQEIESLRQSNARMMQALALLAAESKKREEALFNQTLEGLPEDEQQAKKRERDFQRLESENALYRLTEQSRTQQEAAAQEQIDKGHFAHAISQRLELPNDAQVLSMLMEAASPPEMILRAQRLSAFYKATAVSNNRQEATQAAQSGVHAAGGDGAPSTPPQKAQQRSGDLIDMMRERQYQSEPAG